MNIDPSAVLAVISNLAGQVADVETERDALREENRLLRARVSSPPPGTQPAQPQSSEGPPSVGP